MGYPLRMKIGPSRVFNTYGPIFTRGTKTRRANQERRSMSALIGAACVFVPWWDDPVVQHPARVQTEGHGSDPCRAFGVSVVRRPTMSEDRRNSLRRPGWQLSPDERMCSVLS